MKKIATYVLLAFSLTVCSQAVRGQTNPKIKTQSLPNINDYNTWSLGGHFGFVYPYTDISGSGLDLGFGLDVTKFLTHTFALQARFIHSNLTGEDVYRPDYSFNTTINYDLTLNALFQFGNISFLKSIPGLSLYTSIGFGVVHYSPDIYIDGHHVLLRGIYSQYTQPFDTMDYRGTSDLVIPITFGAKYKISDQVSLMMDYSFRPTNSDKLDGFFKLLSDRDNYSYFGIGAILHLGSRSKNIEWENPVQRVNDELYDLRDKVERMNKDGDADGVTDFYDKELQTPAGSKVYGDGTAVDTDGDGIPDVSDVEPFSAKNAKVDASGKDIFGFKSQPVETTGKDKYDPSKKDTDGDGVADLYDREPSTPFGSKVYGDGTSVDTDGDGVPDIRDAEPFSIKNARVDAAGKNLDLPKENSAGKVTSSQVSSTEPEKKSDGQPRTNYSNLPSVYFASAEDKVTTRNYKSLDYLGHIMSDNPQVKFKLIGRCDAVGDVQFNRTLARKRAQAVKNYLVSKHRIDEGRLTVDYTDADATVKGSNPMNRRVDVVAVE